jgi:enoyl-CoA hydratase
MSPDLLAEGIEVAERLRAEKPAAVVLSGRHGYFSAGVDLKIAPTLDAQGQAEAVQGINRLFAAWYGAPFPVIGAITGHAIAGGLILALCCDYRVVGRLGRFGLAEVKVGIPYPAAALAVVRAELRPDASRSLALRSHLVDADKALALGLFDEQVDDEQVVGRALELAAQFAELPARAYRQTKLALAPRRSPQRRPRRRALTRSPRPGSLRIRAFRGRPGRRAAGRRGRRAAGRRGRRSGGTSRGGPASSA